MKTETEGNSWTHLDKGNISNFESGQFLDSTTAFVCGQKGILKTLNSGEEWFSIWDSACGVTKFSIVYFRNKDEGWLCFPKGDKIYKTNDGGLNWNFTARFNETGGDYYPKTMYFLNENVGFLIGKVITYIPPGIPLTYGFLLKTSNAGQSWSIVTLPSNIGGMYDMKFLNSSTGMIVGGNSSIVKTTNGGNNWFNAVSLFDCITYNKICFINENTGWLLGIYNSGNNKICKTTNAGFTWSNITGESFYNIYSFQFLNENTGWMCGDSGTVYATSNGGSNWSKQLTPTSNRLLLINFINTNTGWVAGEHCSVLKTTSGIIPVSVSSQNVISEKAFELNQNFPNPFNPSTQITYTISSSLIVSLKVFDITGREVTTLINTRQSAGSYRVEFHAKDLPTGIYFYKLETENFSDSKKMILIK